MYIYTDCNDSPTRFLPGSYRVPFMGFGVDISQV